METKREKYTTKKLIESSLYKYEGKYYLVIHAEYAKLPYDILDYGDVSANANEIYYIEEQGNVIIKSDAMNKIAQC